MSRPSSRTRKSRLELDWVVVSVEGVRRWGLLATFVVLAAVLLAAVYYFLHEPIDKKAQRILRRASATQEQLRRAGFSDSLSDEFEQASLLLDQARGDCETSQWAPCLARGKDALRRFELLTGLTGSDFTGSGQIISVQGKVEIQRANQTKWERAREKEPLYNGDFVKTSSGAATEVLFSDGTVYRLGSDTLLEVHREARTGKEPASGEVKLTVGEVNVFTALNQSVVLTESARAEVDRDSRVGVDVAEDQSATVAAYAGSAEVTTSAGERAQLATRQAVRAESSGKLGARIAIPGVPTLAEPAPNVLINLDTSDRVTLTWNPTPGADGYDLQLSRSRVFTASNLEVVSNNRREASATVKVLRPGTYYWRIAAVGREGVRSEWSSPRAFKAYTGRRVEELADTTPPRVVVQRPTQIGNLFLIQGETEPGATVKIDGEPVDVAADGTFKKAVPLGQPGAHVFVIRATDPAGNTSEHREPVYLEAD